MSDEGSQLVLRYSHNVIEHLGLKLYQNKPTRVVAELVSNAWDADSPEVAIEMEMGDGERWVAIHDSGTGMTRKQLAERFLVIGAPKRVNPLQTSHGGRKLMGRKGIGKLAPFGIARTVEVVTVAEQDGVQLAYWLRLELDGMQGENHGHGDSAYHPDVIVEGESPEALREHEEDHTGQVQYFVERLSKGRGTGTLVLMTELTLHRAIARERLIESIGRRFTTTTRSGFEVWVDSILVDTSVSLPAFEFRIPQEDGEWSTTEIGGRPVRYWVGFVTAADWPQDEAGVGVYSHGKIAQDRPFTFGVKGKEIFTRYMYAVVEADWLDEQDDDLISTDRTNVNWDADAAKPLYEWGQGRVRDWVARFAAWRRTDERARNKRRVEAGIAENRIPKITDAEQEQVAELLSDITPQLGKDEDSKARLAQAVSKAWVQEPMRRFIKELWTEIGRDDRSIPEAFASLIDKLDEYAIPESLNLAVIFAQRAFALTRLYELVHLGKEVDLQALLEEFPWIIEPDSVVLTANQQLKTVVKEAEGKGMIPTGRRSFVNGVPERNKPDFVFLSSPEDSRIVVVELKNPQEDLTVTNRAQLLDYLTYLEVHYPNADLQGYLVGRVPSGFHNNITNVRVIPWTEVMQRSRARHISYLAAMLTSAPRDGDARVEQIRDFAGPETWAMLEKMARNDERLEHLLTRFPPSDVAVEQTPLQEAGGEAVGFPTAQQLVLYDEDPDSYEG